MRLSIFFIFVFLLGSCIKEDEINRSFHHDITPQSLNDGHIVSSPSSLNIDSDELLTIYEDIDKDDNLWSLRSLLVFREGALVSEYYYKDQNDITNKHMIWSCTKQVMGVLVGIAIEKGIIESVGDPISKYLGEELDGHQDKKDITIRELITMQSGIDYNNSGAGGQTDDLLQQIPENSVDFILSRPLFSDQESSFHYNDGNPHLISAIIQKKTGMPTDVWADEVFFSKIGVTNYRWERYKDGITMGGFGIETSPRELAKIALCVANGGLLNGESIVSREWVEDMSSSQVVVDSEYSFGYYWWIDPSINVHFMWGHGGQFAFIAPDKDLVVVMTSIPNTQGKYEIQADEALPIVKRIIDIAN